MIDVTKYLKEKGIYSNGRIQDFKRMQRVKYLIASGEKIETKSGRYGGYTLFSENLFSIFVLWLKKQPVPLLNRMEYEVNEFIYEFFGNETKKQLSFNGFIYDWYIPALNLFIEFNEEEHSRSRQKAVDAKKKLSNLLIIHEKDVMKDLAIMAKKYGNYKKDYNMEKENRNP